MAMRAFAPVFAALLLMGHGGTAQVSGEAHTVDAPLPPASLLLRSVEATQRRDEALAQQYTWHVHEVSEEFDGSDAVRKTTIRDSESIPVGGVRVQRLVGRGGEPLSAEQQKSEDEHFDKEVDDARKRAAKRENGSAKGGPISAARMLELGNFTNERRVLLAGRSTIVFDYAGNKQVKPANPAEKIVQDLVGTVWVDESDHVLTQVEGRFLADFKLGFGLVLDIHKGLSFSMRQRKINDEVWLPDQISGTGKASAGLFLLRVHGRAVYTMSDFRKYRASATIVGISAPVPEQGPIPPAVAAPEPK